MSERNNKLTFYFFLACFFAFGAYLRLLTLSAPFLPDLYTLDVVPLADKSFNEIFFSPYNRLINVYRNVFSAFLFQNFGILTIAFNL